MPRFFTRNIGEKHAFIEGEDGRHISRSLRMSVGDEITLSDERGYDYKTVISIIEDDKVTVEIVEKKANETEPQIDITLYQALTKGDKLEFIIQKAVELGVKKVVPILSSRCVSRPKEKAFERRLERLRKISLEAAKQSQRGIVPSIGELISFDKAIEDMKKHDLSMILYENATIKLSEVLSKLPKDIGVMVGSEGGFSPKEVEDAVEKGIKSVSLGKRILRAETAPIVLLSAVSYSSGEF